MTDTVSIVIVNYNSGEYLKKTVDSVLTDGKGFNFEIIVVDNNSGDGSADLNYNDTRVRIIKNSKNEGFGRANNIGVAASSGEYILILNNDTLLLENTVPPLLKILRQNKNTGVAAPLILYPDRTVQPSYGMDLTIFTEFLQKFFFDKVQIRRYEKRKNYTLKPDWVTGACFLIKRSLYEEIGGFDENYFIYVEDADLCRRVRNRGYEIVFTTEAELIHFKGKSTSKCMSVIAPVIKESQLYYYKTHNSRLSFHSLKLYFRLFYRLKAFLYRMKGDSDNLNISRNILKTVKNYR